MAFMNNQSSANIAVGSGQCKGKTHYVGCQQRSTKDRFRKTVYSLRSGSAAIGNVAILVNRADMGNQTHISVADGANMVSGTYNAPGVIEIHASTDVTAYNKTLTESVSGFGLSVAVTETDVMRATRSSSGMLRSMPESVMLKFSLTTKPDCCGYQPDHGVGCFRCRQCDFNARYTGNNTVTNDADVKGRNVEVFAGQAAMPRVTIFTSTRRQYLCRQHVPQYLNPDCAG